VKGVADYQRRLAKAFVVLEAEERRRIIEREAIALKSAGLRRRADIQQLQELANLCEHPAIVRGEFGLEFLSLPSEVLVTVMRHHQKYISVEDGRGQLAPYFLTVLDLDWDPSGEIQSGHEAVLAARFRDAQFFWQADQKRSLAERARLLDQVVFQAQLGSYAKKVNRVVPLTGWMARNLLSAEGRRADMEAASRAASLCKSDLTTEMVGEFPELQGIMGTYYARHDGEPEKVAKAIYEHYQPVAAEAACPSTLEGAALALADKLDTLGACFSAGLAPTGSRDPFALRRAGTGVVRILVEGRLAISLSAALEQAVSGVASGGLKVEDPTKLAAEVRAFLEERARYFFRELRQHPFDEVNAVFAAGWDDLSETASRLEAVGLRPSKDFEPVAAAFKRIRNILEQAGTGRAARLDPSTMSSLSLALSGSCTTASSSRARRWLPCAKPTSMKRLYGRSLRSARRWTASSTKCW
jgi:glycyl-tRNA synthetase beta chain